MSALLLIRVSLCQGYSLSTFLAETAAEAWQSLEEDFVSKKPRKPREVHCTDGERKTYPLQKCKLSNTSIIRIISIGGKCESF